MATIWLHVNNKKKYCLEMMQDFKCGMWSPRTTKTAVHLFSMDAKMLAIRLWGILLHSLRSKISMSRRVKRGLGLAASCHPSMFQTCLIGFIQSTLVIPYTVLFQL